MCLPHDPAIPCLDILCNRNKSFIHSKAIPDGSDGKVSACNAGELSSVPKLGRSPGGVNGNPL